MLKKVKIESSPLGSSLKRMPVLVYIRAWKLCANESMKKEVHFQGVIEGPQGYFLQLRVPNSTWRNEMHYQKQSLLKNFNEACQRLGLHSSQLPTECKLVA